MFWFSLDTLILNLVVLSLCMTLHFEDITTLVCDITTSKNILSTVAGRWRFLVTAFCDLITTMAYGGGLRRLSSMQSLELIELYHDHAPLWDVSSHLYKDRKVRNTAYMSIQLAFETSTKIKLSGMCIIIRSEGQLGLVRVS